MTIWIAVAAIGGLLSMFGLVVLWRRYRHGEITRRYLLAIVVGYISFVSFALISALRPQFASGPASIGILLPAFVATVVLIREHRKSTDSHAPRR